MLLVDGLALLAYISQAEWYPHVNSYYLNQISGHTLFTCFFMWFYARVHRFCLYSKVSIIGLAGLNLFNILYDVFNLTSYTIYAEIIIGTSLVLALIFLIKNK